MSLLLSTRSERSRSPVIPEGIFCFSQDRIRRHTLHSLKTSPTMRRIMKKTAAGSASRWLHSSIWACPALLLLTPVLLMVSGVGAMSGGSLVAPRPGEARVMCPLTEDVWQTKHHVVIRQFLNKRHTVKVFHCDWLKTDPNKPNCRSHHNFTLEALGKDYVVASVPRTQLHKDASYKCQLVPPDDDQPSTTCLVFHSDDAEDNPISGVTPFTAASLPQQRDRSEEEPTGYTGELVVAVVALSFLLLVTVMAVLYVLLRKHRYRIREPPGATNGEGGQKICQRCEA